ncbi:MAG: lytic murein transglycosylase, partial [Pseudomonadota bacterium]
MRFVITILILILTVPAQAQNRAAVEKQFQKWLKQDLWPEARQQGVSQRTFNAAFKDVRLNWKLPDLVPPGTKAKPSRPQAQAEFRSPGRYFNENNIAPLVNTGRKLATKHKSLLARIEKQYGVPGRIILA